MVRAIASVRVFQTTGIKGLGFDDPAALPDPAFRLMPTRWVARGCPTAPALTQLHPDPPQGIDASQHPPEHRSPPPHPCACLPGDQPPGHSILPGLPLQPASLCRIART